MAKVGIVDIACGFLREFTACRTSDLRDSAAVSLAGDLLEEGKEPVIITTGHVPYQPGSRTLAELKKERVAQLLSKHKFGRDVRVVIAQHGFDSFSEARFVTGVLARELDLESLHLVSSDWYMPYGGVIWQRRGWDNGMLVFHHSIETPAGEKTRKLYWRNTSLLQVAISWHLEWALERLAQMVTRQRKNAFTWSGCD